MTAEQSLELSRYLPTWQDKPEAQVVEELASWSSETNRVPDPYFFIISPNGDLISPQTGEHIRDVVGRQRFTYALGEQEFKAFCGLERLSTEQPNRQFLWVSRPHPGLYNDTKFILSEVLQHGETRILFNRAIILDNFAEEDCSVLAEKLGVDMDSLREQPVALKTGDKHWAQYLDEIVKDDQMHQSLEMIKQGIDVDFKKRALHTASLLYPQLFRKGLGNSEDAVEVITASGILGEYGGSCPTTAGGTIAETILRHSFNLIDWKPGECRVCNKRAFVGRCDYCWDCQHLDSLLGGRVFN